ncbi:Hypothetical predicted protein [Paramuricea clavata]|uniref:Uncharacterized protein n=1 Tax=Paramuricea clavata TaxID=317549 RepID=A0A6S7FH70_PARCT|nr:Hypothetical predicted protein [Paramuricea clavata]
MTADERAATATVAGSLKFENGLYEVGIPWNDGEPKLIIESAQDLRRQLSQASPRVTGYLLLKLTKKSRIKPRLWEPCGILKEMYLPSEWNKTPTKRNVLSAIAAVYDPLQFLSPFLVRAKILMQETWRAGLDWDDDLPSDLATKGEWPLARVIEAYQGSDGLVRVVKVKSRNKEYFRPIHRLCPLEYVDEHSDNEDR